MATRKRAPRAQTTAPTSNGNHRKAAHSTPIEREQRELECQLTAAEFEDRSTKMSEAELLIEQLKDKRRGLNGQIADASAERGRLAHIIDTRREMRAVDCAWVDDYAHNVKRLIRQDTGAEVDTRPMTAADLQGTLSLGDALPPVDDADAADTDAADVVVPLTGPRKRGRKRKSATATESTIHAH